MYYSGHGLQVDDDNADEEDEKDEAILAYDNEFIRDDDIGNYIQKMSKRGVDIVFIMDSCYSGTGMKSFNINANPAKPYFRPKYCYKPEWLQRYQTRQDRLSVQQKSTRSMQIVKRIIENNESEKPTAGEDIFLEAEESTPACYSRKEKEGTMPIGSYPEGISQYGCMDMAGNAAEWCEDWANEVLKLEKVLRGGSWLSPAKAIKVTVQRKQNYAIGLNFTGFRTVVNIFCKQE